MHETSYLRILTINGDSSSIKFALFEAGGLFRRIKVRVISTDEEWMIANTA